MDFERIERYGARGEIFKHVVENTHEGTFQVRGVIERVDPLSQTAVVAVEGGDPTQNVANVSVLDLSDGSVGITNDEFTQNLGSYYTRFVVRMPSKIAMGLGGMTGGAVPLNHVVVNFVRGSFKPVIQDYEICLDGAAEGQNLQILIDNNSSSSNPTVRVIQGGAEVNLASLNGVPGSRFAQWVQKPDGAHITVAGGTNLQKILKARNRGAKALKDAMKPRTPAGQMIGWKDGNGEQGAVVHFGDVVSTLSKETSHSSFGSSEPEGQSIKNPLKKLMEGLQVELPAEPVTVILDPNASYGIHPLVSTLARFELQEFQAGGTTYPSLSQMYEGVFSAGETRTKSILQQLKTAPANSANGGMNCLVAGALSAAVADFGSYLQGEDPLANNPLPAAWADPQRTYDPTRANEAFRTSLAGKAGAFAALVAALRISVLNSRQATSLAGALKANPLLFQGLVAAPSAMQVPNLFGFPVASGGFHGLPGSPSKFVGNLRERFEASVKFSSARSGADPYTYGDLLGVNVYDLRQEALAWEGRTLKDGVPIPDLFIPNLAGINDLGFKVGDPFLDRLYTGLGTGVTPGGKPMTVQTAQSWLAGFYAAQARLVIQEVWLIAEQYAEDLDALGIQHGVDPHFGPVAEAVATDLRGNARKYAQLPWTSSFLGYLGMRLFNGENGRKAAQEALRTNLDAVGALTQASLQAIMDKYGPSSTDTLSKIWWSTSLSRAVAFADLLAQVGCFVKTA